MVAGAGAAEQSCGWGGTAREGAQWQQRRSGQAPGGSAPVAIGVGTKAAAVRGVLYGAKQPTQVYERRSSEGLAAVLWRRRALAGSGGALTPPLAARSIARSDGAAHLERAAGGQQLEGVVIVFRGPLRRGGGQAAGGGRDRHAASKEGCGRPAGRLLQHFQRGSRWQKGGAGSSGQRPLQMLLAGAARVLVHGGGCRVRPMLGRRDAGALQPNQAFSGIQ